METQWIPPSPVIRVSPHVLELNASLQDLRSDTLGRNSLNNSSLKITINWEHNEQTYIVLAALPKFTDSHKF